MVSFLLFWETRLECAAMVVTAMSATNTSKTATRKIARSKPTIEGKLEIHKWSTWAATAGPLVRWLG
jgi:hypothetical protein